MKKLVFQGEPLGQTEQYRSIQEVDTVNRDKTMMEFIDKVEPDKGKFLFEQEEGIKLDTEVETVTPEETYALVLDEFRNFCADTSERGNYSIDEIPDLYGYGDSYFPYPDVENLVLIDANYVKFLSLGGIDGQVVWLYGVKNGSAYQPEISGKFCELVMDEENSKRYCAYEFNDGGEGMEIYEYDVDNQEFVRIFTEKN